MFTGLIEATGAIVSITPGDGATRLTIVAPQLAGRWRTGDSIAVNGVCLTALPAADPNHFAADLAEETVQRTTLAALLPGATVNLELPTPAGSPLGGHVVQGHVDGVATVAGLGPTRSASPDADWRLTLDLPPQLLSHVVPQGSITVDGISLTVAHIEGNHIEIAIIPHTYKSTDLHSLTPGSKVNIETDVLARYAARQAGHNSEKKDWLTAEYLLARGY